MDDNDKNFEAYFQGKMSAKQSLDFQTAMEANPQLKSDYDLYVSIKRATAEIKRDKIRSQLKSLDLDEEKEINRTSSSPKNKTSKIFTLIKTGISIAALFMIGFWGYNAAQSTDNEKLFAQNFDVYTVKSSRGGNENNQYAAYKKGNYNAFTVLADGEDHSPELELMLANSYLVMGKVEYAISSLNKISDDSSFRDQKYWYLGLANLKINNFKETKKHLLHLQSLSNYKKQEATKILSKLN